MNAGTGSLASSSPAPASSSELTAGVSKRSVVMTNVSVPELEDDSRRPLLAAAPTTLTEHVGPRPLQSCEYAWRRTCSCRAVDVTSPVMDSDRVPSTRTVGTKTAAAASLAGRAASVRVRTAFVRASLVTVESELAGILTLTCAA